MIVFSLMVVILTTRGGNSLKVQPAPLCSHPARLYPDPNDCQRFFRCIGGKPVSMSCPPRTAFDRENQICAWHDDLKGCKEAIHEDAPAQSTGTRNTDKSLTFSNKISSRTQETRLWGSPNPNPSTDYVTIASAPQSTAKMQTVTTKQIYNFRKEPQITRTTQYLRANVSFNKVNVSREGRLLPSPKIVTIETVITTSAPTERPERGGSMWYLKKAGVTTESSLFEYEDGSQLNNAASRHRYGSVPENYKSTNATNFPVELRHKSANITSTVGSGNISSDNVSLLDSSRDMNFADVNNVNGSNILDVSMDGYPNERMVGVQIQALGSRHISESHVSITSPTNITSKLTKINIIESQENSSLIENLNQSNKFANLRTTEIVNTTHFENKQEKRMKNYESDKLHNITGVSYAAEITYVANTNVSKHAAEGIRNDTEFNVSSHPRGKSTQVQTNMANVINMSRFKNGSLVTAKEDSVKHNKSQVNGSKVDALDERKLKSDKFSRDADFNQEIDNFEELGRLIEPYKSRIDPKYYKPQQEEENSREIMLAMKESSGSETKHWGSGDTDLYPTASEHLREDIVNRDLSVMARKQKTKTMWYDPQVRSGTVFSPTKDTALETFSSQFHEPYSRLMNDDGSVEPWKATKIEGRVPPNVDIKEEPKNNVNKKILINTYMQNEPLSDLISKSVTTESVSPGQMVVREPASLGYRVEAPTRLHTGNHVNVNFMSAPYLVTGSTKPFRCPEPNGHFPDPQNCAVYYHCSMGDAYRRDCPADQVFHPSVQSCVSSSLAPPCPKTFMNNFPEDADFAKTICKDANGLYKDQNSCSYFYECTNGWPIKRKCLLGTVFNDVLRKCSWSKLVPGCEQEITPEAEAGKQAVDVGRFQCPRDGYFRDPDRCHVYFLCAGGEALRMTCDPGTSFDMTLNMCVWNNLVDGCKESVELESEEQDSNIVNANNPKGHQVHTAVYRVKNYELKRDIPSLEMSKFTCPDTHGLYSDPYNCSFFIHCFKKVAYRHQCQPGTVFSWEQASCTWSRLVPGCTNVHGTNSIGYSEREGHANKIETYQQRLLAGEAAPLYKVQQVGLHEFTCPEVVDGFYRDDVFCDIFHRCVLGQRFTFTCPTGTFFRLEENLCDFWEGVTDCTADGVRQKSMGSLPEVVPLKQPLPQRGRSDDGAIGIDADPVPCPASNGLFPHTDNCRQFVFCAHFVPLVLTCPDPLLFNAQTLTCDFAPSVQCFKYDDYRKM